MGWSTSASVGWWKIRSEILFLRAIKSANVKGMNWIEMCVMLKLHFSIHHSPNLVTFALSYSHQVCPVNGNSFHSLHFSLESLLYSCLNCVTDASFDYSSKHISNCISLYSYFFSVPYTNRYSFTLFTSPSLNVPAHRINLTTLN